MTEEPHQLTDAERAALERDAILSNALLAANKKQRTGRDSSLDSLPGFVPVAPIEYWSAVAGDTATAKIKNLIADGADVNSSGDDGYTPLHAAAENGRLENAMTLVRFGAKVNAKTSDGRTPLDFAVESQHVTVIEYLRNLNPETETN